jgi:hypothetical protein
VPSGRRNSPPEPCSTWHCFSSILTTQGDPCAQAWSSLTPRDLANITDMLSCPSVPQSNENVPNPKPPSASANSGEQFTEHQTPQTSPLLSSCTPQTLEPPGKPQVSSFIIRHQKWPTPRPLCQATNLQLRTYTFPGNEQRRRVHH